MQRLPADMPEEHGAAVRRWLKALVRQGVGLEPTAVTLSRRAMTRALGHGQLCRRICNVRARF